MRQTKYKELTVALALLAITKKDSKLSVGLKQREIRGLIICLLITARGQWINFTNFRYFATTYFNKQDVKYRTSTYLRHLVLEGLIRKEGKPKHFHDRQNYVITAAGIIKINELSRTLIRESDKYDKFAGYKVKSR
jgi:hypothetical protein